LQAAASFSGSTLIGEEDVIRKVKHLVQVGSHSHDVAWAAGGRERGREGKGQGSCRAR